VSDEHARHRRDQPASATPALERLLAHLARRLAGQTWLHGTGTLLAVLSVGLAFTFFTDWALHVPVGVRLAQLAVLLIALPMFLVWRELIRHLRRLPPRDGLAVLIERKHPELNDLFVSAVQLQRGPAVDANPELVQRVLREADERAARTSLAGVLDERPQRLRFGVGVGCAAALGLVVISQPELSSIFFARLFGANTPWPQRTHLSLSIPDRPERAQIAETPEVLEVRVARGTDVPVLVRAEGVVPDEVTLHFASGDTVVLGRGGDDTFRTLLRSCQDDLTFTATGGDDRDELPRVHVIVLEPPDIAGLAITIEPPAYTKLGPRVELDRDVEVLAGSKLVIAALPHPATASGKVRVLPDDRLIDLTAMPFPAAADGTPRTGLGFEVVAAQSLRYRFELSDDTGLTNPDPGLFGVQVVADRRPEVEWLAPGRPDVETVATGALRLRARASDDFGLVSMAWRAKDSSATGDDAPWTALELAALPPTLHGDDAAGGVRAVGGLRLDIASLAAPGAELQNGRQFEIELRATDNRPPLADGNADPAGIGAAGTLRVRVLSDDEFLRRLQDRLARLRVQAAELDELQRQKASRAKELLAALESDSPQVEASTREVGVVLTGERRVQGDAEALTRELAGVLEGVLYARIDDKAGALFEDLDTRLAQADAKGFQLEAWRGLASTWSGDKVVATGLASQLLGIVDLALAISAQDAPGAVEALGASADARELDTLHAQLMTAIERQTLAQTHLAQLLDALAEWDNFQSILSLTRDILNRQKSVRDRTKGLSVR
jgi:hypothetical protein